MIGSIRDAALELRITIARRWMLWHEAGRRRAADEFTRLIRLRSAERVRTMEEDRGLR